MTNQAMLSILRKQLGWMLLMGALFGALGFVALMFMQPRYQVQMDFLVVQNTNPNQDFYSQFKSAEYLGKVLGESVYSERFINAVIESGKVNAEMLPFDKKDRITAWQEMVDVKKNLELGVIQVTVRAERERDAARIMDGIGEVLINKNMLFRGGDEKSVEIRVLSGPISERIPTVATMAKTVASAFALGFLFTYAVALCRAPKRSVGNLA